jgi:hypothetical protein
MTMNLRRSLMGPYQRGVPSQYIVHKHPWPTRFHGPLYQRPSFSYPFMSSPQNVFKPGDFYPGELTEPQMVAGLGATDEGRYMAGQEAILFDTGRGIFKPGGYGGGIFDGNLSGITAVSGLGVLGQATGEYPWGAYSEATKALQEKTNAELSAKGYCPLVVDGKLGPRTCGAARAMFTQYPNTCQKFTAPTMPPCVAPSATMAPAAALAPTPGVTVAPVQFGVAPDWKKYAAFAAGAAIVAGGAYFLLRRKKGA